MHTAQLIIINSVSPIAGTRQHAYTEKQQGVQGGSPLLGQAPHSATTFARMKRQYRWATGSEGVPIPLGLLRPFDCLFWA